MDFNARVLINYAESSFTGTVENLSLKGLFVRTDQKVPLDETVGIILSFAGNNGNLSLSLEGRVVRISDDGIALNFKKISIDSLEQTLEDNQTCSGDSCIMKSDLCRVAV